MKIRCDNCATVFMIDDSLISDKGVKAQCPKCGHQKVVWKHNAIQETSWIDAPEGSSAATANPSGWMDEPLSGVLQEKLASMDKGPAPLLGGSPPLFGGGDAARGGSLLPGGPSANLYPLSSASSDSLYPAGEQEPLGGALYGAGARGASLYPASPSQDLLPPLGLEYEDSLSGGGFGVPTSMVYKPHGAPETLSLDEEAGDSLALHVPPTTLTARGTIASNELGRKTTTEAEPPPVDPEWIKVRRSSDKKEIGPMTLQEVRSLYAHGKISLLDECAGRDGAWRLIKAVPEIESILSRTPQITEKTPEVKGATKAAKSSSEGGSFIWVVLSLFLLGGGAGAAYFLRPYLKSNKGPNPEEDVPRAGLLETKIERWKKSYPGLKASPRESKKIAEKGMALFYRDLQSDYRAANEVFQQALVAWDKNGDVIAAIALSVLWGSQGLPRQGRIIEEFEEILREHTKKIPTNQAIKAAFAAFLARQGEFAKATEQAKQAAAKAPKDPLVLLVLGELLLQQERTALEARPVLERVVETQPKMARARYLLAKIQIQSSNHYQAAQNLEPLVQNKHLPSLFLMAELQNSLGNYREAKQILNRLLAIAPQDDEARLLLGILEYQTARNFAAAKRLFARLNQNSTQRGVLRRALLHLAYVALEENQTQKGLELIAQLEKLDKHFLPILFAKAQILAAKRSYPEATAVLNRLLPQVSEPPQQLLLGYLHNKQKQPDKANQVFQQIASENQRFIWSHLFLAANAIEANNATQAFIYIKNALDIEPPLYMSNLRVGPYPLSRRFLRGLAKTFRDARTEDASITLAAAGIVYYQLGDSNEASNYLKRARSRDANALAANLYLSQIAYEKKQYAAAQNYARRVFQTYNQHPVAGTLLGLCEFQKDSEKKALGYFAQIEEARPWYLYGRAHRLILLHKKGEKKEAQELARSLLTLYRHNHDLLRILYSIQW